ncbi:MAG: hypothetical protein PHQ23_06430 [Candidatus Wallbacteria bacterium]|nr:hypothetical protein [Candidatus Wallbacteria bacterium]
MHSVRRGQGLLEYCLILGLISLAVVVAMTSSGDTFTYFIERLQTVLESSLTLITGG